MRKPILEIQPEDLDNLITLHIKGLLNLSPLEFYLLEELLKIKYTSKKNEN